MPASSSGRTERRRWLPDLRLPGWRPPAPSVPALAGLAAAAVTLLLAVTLLVPRLTGRPRLQRADGATVAWVDGSGAEPRLARAPSAGGPVLTVSLR